MMVLALLIVGYTYFPLIMLYLHPPTLNKEALKSGEYIIIPKINAQARIIENVDPWNQTEYSKALEKGVAQAKGTSMIGNRGTIFLFAHSSEDPWKITRENISFFRLFDLKENDRIELYKEGKKHSYYVTGKKEVWPNEVKYLTQSQGDVVILQTCTPIGTSLKRLLVFAKPY